MILTKEIFLSGSFENNTTKEFISPAITKTIYWENPNFLTDASYTIDEFDDEFEVAGVSFNPVKITYNNESDDPKDKIRLISDKEATEVLMSYWKATFDNAIRRLESDGDSEGVQELKSVFHKYKQLLEMR